MKPTAILLIPVLSFVLIFRSHAQETGPDRAVFPSGIFLKYGLASYGVKDEYISKEKYSGTLPYYSLEWVRFHPAHGYRLQFEYSKSTDVKNNQVSAEAQQATFSQDFFYPLGDPARTRKMNCWLGPSVQVFYYEIYYHFAQPGSFISPSTTGTIFSLGINATGIYSLAEKWTAEGFLRSNVLSVAGKAVDELEYQNALGPSFLTLFTTTRLDAEARLRYSLFSWMSLSLSYKFDLSRIHRWDPYIAGSHGGILSIQIKL